MAATFEIYKDNKGEFRFRLRAANGEVIAVSEGYASKESCIKGIDSVRINAATAGITFGVFTLSGALLGAGSALLGGKRMVTTEIRGPKLGGFQMKKTLGDFVFAVGPNKNIQFPFILLDRALIYFSHVINWAHGRRGRKEEEAPDAGPETFVAHLTDRQRAICREFFRAASTGDEMRTRETKQPMLEMLIEILHGLSNREYR